MDFQKEELNEILNIFQQESAEIISSMDKQLLILEQNPKNEDCAIQLFRNAHSLKGSARMLGFVEIQDVVHKIEDIISLVKENKLTLKSDTVDYISECLQFVLGLINKTVENKEEFKSPKTREYVEKLVNIAKNEAEIFEEVDIATITDENKKSFCVNLNEIENSTVEILYIISKARQEDNYEEIKNIKPIIDKLLDILKDIQADIITTIKKFLKQILDELNKYENSSNKKLDYIELNNSIIAFVEEIKKYATKEKIKIKEYYEIIDERLKNKTGVVEKKEAVVVDSEKLNDFIQKLPLLEINATFNNEVLDVLKDLISKEKNQEIKEIYADAKEIITAYKINDKIITHDIYLALKDVIEAIKNNEQDLITENKKKLSMIKTMVVFQQKKTSKNDAVSQVNQKEILSTITNAEIKTLRIDSSKLDTLVGEIGELIVSKIKTNEQLNLSRKINNDLIEWQKSFLKMNSCVKYFDKKYLSGQTIPSDVKMASYNKQLSNILEQHAKGLNVLINEMGDLFKQIQENETQLTTTIREIETMVKNMRILPLSAIFKLFPRMVHNIAKEKGKKIELVINGDDTSADKTIIEEIKIPLMHIIRNSIDHGIEDVETRISLGKNLTGLIEISAMHQDNNIVIDVKDDGRGLDVEKIKQKAIEKKILTPEEISAISDSELTNLIFYPGFSTEDLVTELSGRGLGLDIVNNKITDLQGRIDIFSELNKGTVVRITLPAIVATKKVFVIEESKQFWAIETSVIKTILRINAFDIFEKDNNNYFIYDGNAIQIYTLSQLLSIEKKSRKADKFTLLVIETDNITFGVIVEKLIADQEIVHKKISPPLYRVKNISGITTLANGEACLIVNITDVVSAITSKKVKTKILLQSGIEKAKENSKYNILVVDDSYTTRILQQNILINNGYSVFCATSPIHALDELEKKHYDLILSDVQMPEMNGFEFVKKVRKNINYQDTPVIVVSSEPIENYSKEIKETRILKYIPKNLFRQDELIKYIEGILNY